MERLDIHPYKETPKFESLIKNEIINFKTGETFQMLGGIEMTFTEEDTKNIAKICSQEEVYDILFSRRLDGEPYTEENASAFINWVKKGWEEKTHFVFIVRNTDNRIVGAIDIKSPNLEGAEVGYWADKEASGFMTNTLQSLETIATEAGYKKLYAKVIVQNEKSASVLLRAGFKEDAEREFIEDREYLEFNKDL